MKKKIKDLTITECIDICDKQRGCENCPLEKALCVDRFSWHEKYDKDLESEVEVDE